MTKWIAIALLALCQVLALCLWFSAAAILPALSAEFAIGGIQAALISSSVAVGFVAGTLTSAVLGVADRFDPRRVFMASALVAAAANLGVLVVAPDSLLLPALRFVVGASMAGIYPPAMKMIASWARMDMGLLVGILTAAMTLGTAAPHLIDVLGGLDWRWTIMASSALAALAGLLINLLRLGPNLARAGRFRAHFALRAWSNPAVRLANFGYLGHMWELYAVWAWVGVFLDASFRLDPGGAEAPLYARLLAFATIGIGALGCILGGLCADRWGRTATTMTALAVSGSCCLLVGVLYGGNPWLLAAVCLVWGVAVPADSAQFSASVIELSPPELIGTMLTVQTCAGFLLTTVTIHLIPPLTDLLGWQYAFAVLALGPLFGIWAMGRLRARPEALNLAGGAR
ncbi:MAG: MFS transporter [Alphaproteobacteria bacterium]|nr:MFS transporter [Alphaproteobacteria bacterium]